MIILSEGFEISTSLTGIKGSPSFTKGQKGVRGFQAPRNSKNKGISATTMGLRE